MSIFRRFLSQALLILILAGLMLHPADLHAQDDEPRAHVYGLLGLTVPLLPQSFSRSHEVGFGGTAGAMVRTPFSTAVFAEVEYGYTPVSFLGILVDYGTLRYTGIRGGVRYFLADNGGPQPFLVFGGGLSYARFGSSEDAPDQEQLTQPDNSQYPERSNHWHPQITGGGGTTLNIQDGLSVKSEVQIHLALMEHGSMFSATPRIGVIYTW